MKQSKSKHEMDGAMKYLKPILTGTAVGAVATTVLLMLMSLLLSMQDIPQMLVSPMVLAALAVGAFAGGNFAARLTREKGLFVGLCCGALLFLMIWLCGLSVNDGFTLLAVCKLATTLLCAAIGGIAGANLKKRRK